MNKDYKSQTEKWRQNSFREGLAAAVTLFPSGLQPEVQHAAICTAKSTLQLNKTK